MGYSIDLSSITLENYREKLINGYLPPSRRLLTGNIEGCFGVFQQQGIRTVQELFKLLKNKNKFSELSKLAPLNESYLTILLREIGSMIPKPVRINEIKCLSTDTISKLGKVGLTDTLKLFNKVQTELDREALAKQTGIPVEELLTATKLTDLSRIRWVGATFAMMLLEIGFDTVEKVSKADYVILHEKINSLNKQKHYFKGQIGANDIRYCVEAAGELPFDIEY
jgi:hypothetical protein